MVSLTPSRSWSVEIIILYATSSTRQTCVVDWLRKAIVARTSGSFYDVAKDNTEKINNFTKTWRDSLADPLHWWQSWPLRHIHRHSLIPCVPIRSSTLSHPHDDYYLSSAMLRLQLPLQRHHHPTYTVVKALISMYNYKCLDASLSSTVSKTAIWRRVTTKRSLRQVSCLPNNITAPQHRGMLWEATKKQGGT